jgi:molybdate transport system substrate-binding protein
MVRQAFRWLAILPAMAIAANADVASAAEIKVLTAGAMRGVLVQMLPQFEKQTGHTANIDNATAGTLSKRIEGGESFDVAIITTAIIDELIQKGKIATGSKTVLAKVGIGVAVKEGAPQPDIKTVEAFKAALVNAASVAYIDPASGGSSGIYFDKLLDQLGIADQVRPKAKLKQGGYVADLVASGEAEVAVHQISEIVPVKGVKLVGPLPAEVQNFTVYAAGIGPAAKERAAGKALIDYLAEPASAPVLEAKGMMRP